MPKPLVTIDINSMPHDLNRPVQDLLEAHGYLVVWKRPATHVAIVEELAPILREILGELRSITALLSAVQTP